MCYLGASSLHFNQSLLEIFRVCYFVKLCFGFFHLNKEFSEHECVNSVKQCMYGYLGLAREQCLNGVLGQAKVASL